MARSVMTRDWRSMARVGSSMVGSRLLGREARIDLARRTPWDRVYHFHVRKSAGTSLNYGFFALGGEDPHAVEERLVRSHFTLSHGYGFVSNHNRLIESGRYVFATSHKPYWALDLPPRTYTITVLRDPVQRVLSLYHYLSAPTSDDGYAFAASSGERRLAAHGIDRFLDEIPTRLLLNQVRMFSSSCHVEEAATVVRSLSCVIGTDTFDAQVGRLGETLGLDLPVRRERSTGATRRPVPPSVIQRLQEMVRPEYAFLALVSDRSD
jgi:hypothetical protein